MFGRGEIRSVIRSVLHRETAGLVRIDQLRRAYASGSVGIGAADNSAKPLQRDFEFFGLG